MKHNRKVLEVTGVERVKFLNDLLTMQISDGMGLRYGALLSAQGKIQTDLFVWSEGEALFIDLPASQYQSTKTKLQMYKLRAKVDLNDTVLDVFQTLEGGMIDPRNAKLGCRLYGEGLDGGMTESEYTRRRVAALVPEFEMDFDTNEAYPIEWRFSEMNAIDYKKGCYIGQEIAARMRHKTVLQKTIKPVKISSDIIEGREVLSGEKVIGKLLSRSGRDAMAFLKISAMSDNMRVGESVLTLNL